MHRTRPRCRTALFPALLLAGSLAFFPHSPQAFRVVPSAAYAAGAEPGLVQLNVDQVWPYYKGEGITVAVVGPGADFQHPAVARQYRGRAANGTVSHDYNWADFYSGTPYPTDPSGVGTFLTGLVVGDDGAGNQIGAAPSARWIAVRAVTPEQRHAAFRWLLAPCRLDGSACDPTRAPQVVLGAFWDTSAEMLEEFRADIEALHAAGIVTVFPVGNAHQGSCGSALPPGALDITLGIGAVDVDGVVAGFSGRGHVSGTIKPDLVAPGVEVRSAWGSGGYVQLSTTTASAAYVAGILALLREANPSLLPREAYEILRSTARGTAAWCGSGTPTVPNNVYGWGVPDALAAVTSTATTGRLQVVAVSSGGLSLAGAAVTVTNEADQEVRTAELDGSGSAALALEPGSYTVSIHDPRHYPFETSGVGVAVLTGGALSVTLQERPVFWVRGALLDEAGSPLSGRVEFVGPDDLYAVVEADGNFAVRLHQGRYSYRGTSAGRVPASGQLELSADEELNLILPRSERMLIVHHGHGEAASLVADAARARQLELDVVDASDGPVPRADELSGYRYVVWLDGLDVLERGQELADLLGAGGGVAVFSEELANGSFLDSPLAPALGAAGYYPDLMGVSQVTVTLPILAARGPYGVEGGPEADGWVVASDGVTAALANGWAVSVAKEGPGRSLLMGVSLARLAGSEAGPYLADRVVAWVTGLPNHGLVWPLFPDVVPDGGGVRFIVDLPFDVAGWREVRASVGYSVTRSRRIMGFRAVDGVWPQDPPPVSLAWTFARRGPTELYLWGRRGDGSTVFLGALSGAQFAPGLPTLLDALAGGPALGAVRSLADRGLTQLPAGTGVGTYGFGQGLASPRAALSLVRSLGWQAPEGGYLDVADRLGILSGTYTDTLSRGQVLVAIYRTMLKAGFWRNDVVPVDPPARAYCPRRPGPCTVRLYPGLQDATPEMRQAVATYLHYLGTVPGADARRHPGDPLQWSAPAERGWFAQVFWKALRHRESIRGRPLPVW